MEAAAGSGRSAGGTAGGAGSDCEGEDQEDSSSSSHSNQALCEGISDLNIRDSPQENDANRDNETELQAFRQQWQRELKTTPSPQREPPSLDVEAPAVTDKIDEPDDELSVFRMQWQRELEGTPSPQRAPPKPIEEPQTEEEKAKQLFLRGVEYERGGKLYEAIQHYKRAMQILPDVETRLYESSELRNDTPEEESEGEDTRPEPVHDDDDDDEEVIEGEDLVTRFQRILARKGRLFEQEYPAKGGHISWLPYEVVLVLMRWVVSADLDALSLERLAATCRGFYVAAREPDLWRSLAVRTWGLECGSARAHGFSSWRSMYIARPRLQLHGCYISKTTYLRHGENSFQDQFYRPWYIIDYYRYLRFFPEGLVLMWTTAEEPAASVGQLRARTPKPGLGILAGHYRLSGNKVVIMIKKTNGEKKPVQASNTRFRSRRSQPVETYEQTFHLELELRSPRARRNAQLVWQRYAVSARREQWTQFDLSPAQFPPFAFSRVRNYTAQAAAPLPSTHAYF